MTLVRLKDSGSQAGAVSALDVSKLVNSARLVTPVRNAGGKLKLITWEIGNDGAISRLGDSGQLGGPVTSLAVARSSPPGEVYTAGRGSGGTLKLVRWTVSAGGSVSVADSGQSGRPTSAVGIGRAGQLIVTTVRTNQGRLVLDTWKSVSGQGLTHLGSSGTAAGGVADLAPPTGSTQFVTPAIVTCNEILRLITWKVDAAGKLIRLGDSGNQAGAVGRVASAQMFDRVVTAVRDGGGNLKLIFWQVKGNGTIVRLADSGAGGPALSHVAIAPVSADPDLGVYRVLTAIRSAADGRLRLHVWENDNGSVKLLQDSGEQAGEVTLVRLIEAAPSVFVTAVRASERLKLISWKVV